MGKFKKKNGLWFLQSSTGGTDEDDKAAAKKVRDAAQRAADKAQKRETDAARFNKANAHGLVCAKIASL